MERQQIAYQILARVEKRKDEMTGFLAKLTRLESPSTVPVSQQSVLMALKDKLETLDYFTFLIPGRQTGGHLYARPIHKHNNHPVQLLVGHCDTVWPLGTINEMPVVRKPNTLAGPGVYDMKSGLVQAIYAIQILRELSFVPSVLPVFLINSDEEIGSHESTRWIRALAKIADRTFVMEPALGLEGRIKTARKGVGRFTLVVKGKAAHAGLDPGKGASAIVALSQVVQQLFDLNDPERGITVNVGMIEGGIRPNIVAPESRAVVDVRVPTQADGEMIEKQILALRPSLPDVEIEISGFFGRPPMERTPRNQKLWEIALETGRVFGWELEQAMAGGGSDGNTTSLYTATLDGMGAVGDGAHARHEFAYIDKMVERAALLASLIMVDSLQGRPPTPDT